MPKGYRTSGQWMYEDWQAAMNRAAVKRGNSPEPAWRDLKPWLKRVWERAASCPNERSF